MKGYAISNQFEHSLDDETVTATRRLFLLHAVWRASGILPAKRLATLDVAIIVLSN
jgi:hypothetical protein